MKVLTHTQYLDVYKQLNNSENMVIYKPNTIILLYCDDNIVSKRSDFEKLKEADTHVFRLAHLPIDEFRLLELDCGNYLLCKKEELRNYIRIH
jgi:hypothetical protein